MLGDAVEYMVVDQDPELAFCALASRATPDKQDCSVDSCLYQFTEVEHLTQNNSLLCVTCTKRHIASKALDGIRFGVFFFHNFVWFYTKNIQNSFILQHFFIH